MLNFQKLELNKMIRIAKVEMSEFGAATRNRILMFRRDLERY